jgi:PASTA domain-containing protein
MSSFYSITPLSGQMSVKDNAGEISFSVANNTDRVLQTRFDLSLDQQSPAKKEWLQVDTKPCNIPPKGTVQVIVKMKAPPGTQGAYNFGIVAAAAPRTDEDFTVGPAISFTLAKTSAPNPTPFQIKWWMVLIAAVLLLGIVGGVLALVLGHHSGVPNVVQKKSDEATQILESAGFKVKINQGFYSGKEAGIVQDQTPKENEAPPADNTVVLDVSSALATVPCVEGLTVFDATMKLKNAGLQVGDETYTTDGTAPNNAIVTQNPRNEVCTPHPSGLKVTPGTKVNLQIKRQG